jgi:hypothetical protein
MYISRIVTRAPDVYRGINLKGGPGLRGGRPSAAILRERGREGERAREGEREGGKERGKEISRRGEGAVGREAEG